MAKYDENFFKIDGEEKAEFKVDALLAHDETLLWQGKPNKKAYILSNIIKMLPIAILWLAVDTTMIVLFAKFVPDIPIGAKIGIAAFFVIHLAPVWIWLYNVATASKRHANTEYAFTDKRIIIKTGLIGIDVQNIYYSDIQSINVKVGIADKMLKVGDIYIKCNEHAQVLWDLPTPYALANRLQKIALDIKSDIHFPNAMRPEENTGYKTKYKSDVNTEVNDDDLKL